MLQKISDQDLRDTVLDYQKNKCIEKFRSHAGLWIMENARLRYKLEEDELSELFITFYMRAEKCIEFFIRKDYTDLPSFLSVYAKHMALNILRKRRQQFTEEYLQLWQEERINKDTEELIHHSPTYKIQDCLQDISSMGRIIICLRFNLKMSEDDLRILYKCLKKQNKPLANFQREYENRILQQKEKRENLILNLNNCNRKIYNSSSSYPLLAKKRKKKLLNRLQNTHIIYSIKEMSLLFSMSRHQTGRLYRSSMEIIKEKLTKNETFISKEQLAA